MGLEASVRGIGALWSVCTAFCPQPSVPFLPFYAQPFVPFVPFVHSLVCLEVDLCETCLGQMS